MPYERHSFFNDVKQIPSSLATAFSGRWKYFESSSSLTSLLRSGPWLVDGVEEMALVWMAMAIAVAGAVVGKPCAGSANLLAMLAAPSARGWINAFEEI